MAALQVKQASLHAAQQPPTQADGVTALRDFVSYADQLGNVIFNIDHYGNVTYQGQNAAIKTVVGSYTVLCGQLQTGMDRTILVDATSGAATATLPAAASVKGQLFTIKKKDVSANAVTVRDTTANIDAASTYSLATLNKYVTVQSDGTQYYVIANN